MSKNWFSVDKAGLGKQAEQHSKGRLIGELVQNALDEEGVTTINITLALVPGRPLADLTVEDDSPEGFKDLTPRLHAIRQQLQAGQPGPAGSVQLRRKARPGGLRRSQHHHDDRHGDLRRNRGPHREAPAKAGPWLRLPGPHQADEGGIC